MAAEVKNGILEYWKGVVAEVSQKVEVENGSNTITIHGSRTKAAALYGKDVPYFIAKYTKGGLKPVHFVNVKLEVDGNKLKVTYNDWTELGPSYVGSAEKKTSEFASKCGLKLIELESDPDEGNYTALFTSDKKHSDDLCNLVKCK